MKNIKPLLTLAQLRSTCPKHPVAPFAIPTAFLKAVAYEIHGVDRDDSCCDRDAFTLGNGIMSELNGVGEFYHSPELAVFAAIGANYLNKQLLSQLSQLINRACAEALFLPASVFKRNSTVRFTFFTSNKERVDISVPAVSCLRKRDTKALLTRVVAFLAKEIIMGDTISTCVMETRINRCAITIGHDALAVAEFVYVVEPQKDIDSLLESLIESLGRENSHSND